MKKHWLLYWTVALAIQMLLIGGAYLSLSRALSASITDDHTMAMLRRVADEVRSGNKTMTEAEQVTLLEETRSILLRLQHVRESQLSVLRNSVVSLLVGTGLQAILLIAMHRDRPSKSDSNGG